LLKPILPHRCASRTAKFGPRYFAASGSRNEAAKLSKPVKRAVSIHGWAQRSCDPRRDPVRNAMTPGEITDILTPLAVVVCARWPGHGTRLNLPQCGRAATFGNAPSVIVLMNGCALRHAQP